jgi:hypothetical protein
VNVPGSQREHMELPSVALKLPTAQREHEVAPSPEKNPAVQSKHVELAELE